MSNICITSLMHSNRKNTIFQHKKCQKNNPNNDTKIHNRRDSFTLKNNSAILHKNHSLPHSYNPLSRSSHHSSRRLSSANNKTPIPQKSEIILVKLYLDKYLKINQIDNNDPASFKIMPSQNKGLTTLREDTSAQIEFQMVPHSNNMQFNQQYIKLNQNCQGKMRHQLDVNSNLNKCKCPPIFYLDLSEHLREASNSQLNDTPIKMNEKKQKAIEYLQPFGKNQIYSSQKSPMSSDLKALTRAEKELFSSRGTLMDSPIIGEYQLKTQNNTSSNNPMLTCMHLQDNKQSIQFEEEQENLLTADHTPFLRYEDAYSFSTIENNTNKNPKPQVFDDKKKILLQERVHLKSQNDRIDQLQSFKQERELLQQLGKTELSQQDNSLVNQLKREKLEILPTHVLPKIRTDNKEQNFQITSSTLKKQSREQQEQQFQYSLRANIEERDNTYEDITSNRIQRKLISRLIEEIQLQDRVIQKRDDAIQRLQRQLLHQTKQPDMDQEILMLPNHNKKNKKKSSGCELIDSLYERQLQDNQLLQIQMNQHSQPFYNLIKTIAIPNTSTNAYLLYNGQCLKQ